MGATMRCILVGTLTALISWMPLTGMTGVGANGACGNETVTLEPMKSHHLQSPGYPSDVTTSMECDWLITASPGMRIQLTVHDLHIREFSDGFAVYNIGSNNLNKTGSILGNIREVNLRKVTSSGQVIRVQLWKEGVYWRDGSGTRMNTGFRLELQEVAADYFLQTDCNNHTVFLCDSGDVCLDREGVCNAIMDCPDQSDERNCSFTCPQSERCSSRNTCLQRRLHCDGIRDCPSAEDELNCDVRLCPMDCICTINDELFNILMMNVNCSGLQDTTGVLQMLPRLTNGIMMRRDRITDLEPGALDGLPFLVRLDFERNNLSRLKHGIFNSLKNLKILKLNTNNLVTIDAGVFEPLAKLEVLRLDSNNLYGLNEGMFLGLGRLTFIRLANNEITSLEPNNFRHLSSLISLDLVGNRISSIEVGAFSGLNNLKSLLISENLLTVLHADIFTGLPSLHNLEFVDNPWSVIEPGAFNGLESLKLLLLTRRGNETADVTVDKHELEHLTNLTLLTVDDPKMCCLIDYKAIGLDKCIPDNKFNPEIPFISCNRIMHNSVLRVFIWCLGISALIGNAGIIIWRLSTKDSGKRSQSVLILNLAVSDLIMGLYMLIVGGADLHYQDNYFLHAADWKSGPLCKFAGFLSMLSSEASVFFITMISIDRFLCVVFPFGKKWFRLESAKVASAVMWLIALSISVPPVFLQDIFDAKNQTFYGLYDVCVGLPLVIKPKSASQNKTLLGPGTTQWNGTVTHKAGPSWIFSATIYLGINFFCCLVVIVCYAAIAFVVIIKLPAKKLHKRKDREHRRKEMTMATRMLLIVGTDFCCWMPVIIMGILSQTGAVDIPDETYAWVVVFVIPINSAINPYLYTVSNANIASSKCCPFGKPSMVDSVRMKPLVTSQTKDMHANRRSRSGTNTNL